MLRLKVVLIAAVLFFAACEKNDVEPEDNTPTETGWNVEVIDSIPGVDVGVFNMLEYDKDSGIHVAYIVDGESTDLKYAYKPYNGSWTTSDVTSDIENSIIDIAVDNQKNTIIIYRSNEDDCLHIAEKSSGGSFTLKLVNVLGDQNSQARYPALFADQNNMIHISFERANYGIYYTTYTYGGVFEQAQQINNEFGSSSSDIVIDSDGNKHIIFQDGSRILYAHSAALSSDWTVGVAAELEFGYQGYETVSLAIDRLNNLHAAYKDGTSDNNIKYLFKEHNTETWFMQGIGNDGGSNRLDRAIACDTLNQPHILYDQSFGLNMASKNITWTFDHIKGNSDYRCDNNYDLVITEFNKAHASFYCRTTGVLLYATKQIK
jgi:frataxin-like iron-binding protein CyaY